MSDKNFTLNIPTAAYAAGVAENARQDAEGIKRQQAAAEAKKKKEAEAKIQYAIEEGIKNAAEKGKNVYEHTIDSISPTFDKKEFPQLSPFFQSLIGAINEMEGYTASIEIHEGDPGLRTPVKYRELVIRW